MAEEPEHCFACYRLILPGQTYYLTIDGIAHCEDCALSEGGIRVREDLAVEVKRDRLLIQRGKADDRALFIGGIAMSPDRQFLGLVHEGKFRPLTSVPGPNGYTGLTTMPTSTSLPPEEHELDLAEYEGKAIMVQGHGGGKWVYSAKVVDEAGPILTAVVTRAFRPLETGTKSAEEMLMTALHSRMIDLQDADAQVRTAAMVMLERSDGTPIVLLAAFPVDKGETLSSLVRREGDRKLYDPVENRVYRLGELYAMAREEALGAPVSNLLEALVPLEGLKIEATRLREAHRKLKEELDAEGFARLERDYAGAPAAAPKLAVVNLRGVGRRTPLGEEIANMPLADVASMKREDFVREALKRAQPGKEARAERLAKEVWTRTTYVVSVAENWRDR